MYQSEQHKNKGICFTCNNASICMYLENSKKTVFECDEFEDSVLSSRVKHVKEETKSVMTNTQKYKGLCSDCEKLLKCMYSNVERGVLHCEEYASKPLCI